MTGLGLGLSSRQALAQIAMLTPLDAAAVHDARLQDYLDKMRNFERPHPDDVFVDAGELHLLRSCAERLGRVGAVMWVWFFSSVEF